MPIGEDVELEDAFAARLILTPLMGCRVHVFFRIIPEQIQAWRGNDAATFATKT